MGRIDRTFWQDRKVLITGHTGFKGAWLSFWLQGLGARVVGISNGIPTKPSLYQALDWGGQHLNVESDIRDRLALSAIVRQTTPEVVFHLAAQSLVRQSYLDPISTFSTNVMGTVNVLETARSFSCIKSIINVTSDKCYENLGEGIPYRETDKLGGRDPYSASKACSELVTACYRHSYFATDDSPSRAGLASARAGNVIGGGDWGAERLIPDCVRAFLKKEPVLIRNPEAVRPWQHVLDALRGYIILAQCVYTDPAKFSGGFNFGPDNAAPKPVSHILSELAARWGSGATWEKDTTKHPQEATSLRLDNSYAKEKLLWRPLLSLEQSLDMTVEWYKSFDPRKKMTAISREQIAIVESLETA